MPYGQETQSKVEQLLLKKNGDKKTIDDAFELSLAIYHDLSKGQREIHDLLKNDNIRLQKIEHWALDWEETCPDRMKTAIKEEHAERHNAYVEEHMKDFVHLTKDDMDARLQEREYIISQLDSTKRSGDKEGEDHTSDREQDRQVWLMWMVGSRLGYILVAALTAVLVSVLHVFIYGTF